MPYIGVSPFNGVRKKHTYTATASQTSFSGAGAEGITLSYKDSTFVDVFQNGVKLGEADYTSTSGTAIVLAQGASLNDIVEVVVYDVFSVADTVSKADGGTFDNAVTIATDDNNSQLTLVSTDADASVGPQLDLFRNSASPADSDVFGRIRFLGENDASEQTAYATIFTKAVDVSDGTEDANLRIDSIVGGTNTQRLEFNATEAVFNEGSADIDFRVESNDDADMFVVNGGTNIIGVGTNAPDVPLHVSLSGQDAQIRVQSESDGNASRVQLYGNNASGAAYNAIQSHINGDSTVQWEISGAKASAEDKMLLSTGGTERMRLNNDAHVFFGTTTTNVAAANQFGVVLNDNSAGSAYLGTVQASANGNGSLFLNRGSDDGVLAIFKQAGTDEGSISVSGSTVSYNAFSGSHWSRLTDNSKPTILKGTIVETIDEMCDWYNAKFTVAKTDDSPEYVMFDPISLPKGKSEGDKISHTYLGITYDNAVIVKENDNKHVKCKISDTKDSKRVYGVFANWDNDDDTVNDMYVTAIGTHVVRINKDVTVSAGDLISSNGDGTAKVQDDDIIRSKTIGKVLTNIKQETYDDGSYTVPCALYCG